MEPDACLGYRISTPFPLIFHSQSPPPGEVRSSHLRCCASLKKVSLFLRSRVLHLAASRLAETAKSGEMGY